MLLFCSANCCRSAFSKTHDDRFILKFVHRVESQFFLTNAMRYFEYMTRSFYNNLPTVFQQLIFVSVSLCWRRRLVCCFSGIFVMLYYAQCLVKILGVYQFKWKRASGERLHEHTVIVMPNLFYNRYPNYDSL